MLLTLALKFTVRSLSIDLKGMTEYKSTCILAYAEDLAVTSWFVSHATEIYSELVRAANKWAYKSTKIKQNLFQ
jgi:hypothetical protein